MPSEDQKQIAGAIKVAGLLIAGAVLLKDARAPGVPTAGAPDLSNIKLDASLPDDRALGNPNAKVVMIEYADFQCPFCGRFHNDTMRFVRENYIDKGKVKFIYRDYAFLGSFVKPYDPLKDESIKAAEAARCAGDQGKFWQYHDYLYDNQNGENEGAFSASNLKKFAGELELDRAEFDQCLNSAKYKQAVMDSNTKASLAGVTGTPKAFILKNGKVVGTIDGAIPLAQVTAKLDSALK